MRFRDHARFDSLAPLNRDQGQREIVAVRWSIAADRTLGITWPQPGDETSCLAMGWVAADRPIGVITFPAEGLAADLLDILDQRFPDRRWFAGNWDATHADATGPSTGPTAGPRLAA